MTIASTPLLNKRILLAEDSEDNLLVFTFHLQSVGATVDTAKNGRQALEQFKAASYDMVVMDLQMPVMDGFAATEAIRKWEKEQQLTSIPIIALTAASNQQNIDDAMAAGCNNFLSKPLTRESLLTLLDNPEFQPEPEPTPVSEGESYRAILPMALEPLVPQILEVKRKQMVGVQEALNDQNFQALQKLGHKIRGSHGLQRVNELALLLEEAAKDKDLSRIEKVSVQLGDFLEHVQIGFEGADHE